MAIALITNGNVTKGCVGLGLGFGTAGEEQEIKDCRTKRQLMVEKKKC